MRITAHIESRTSTAVLLYSYVVAYFFLLLDIALCNTNNAPYHYTVIIFAYLIRLIRSAERPL